MISDLVRKEWLDLKRDRRLLLTSILLPMLLLPLVGAIIYASVASQPPIVLLINNDTANIPYVNFLEKYAEQQGAKVYLNNGSSVVPDVEVIFPSGFAQNISSVNGTAYVEEITLVSSQSDAVNIVNDGLYKLAVNVSLTRISTLSREAHTPVNPEAVRDPLVLKLGYISPEKRPTTGSVERLGQLTRVVSLILFPAATPVIFFLTDGILGEKERKTLEALLASPVSPFELVISKLVIAMMLGFISSLGDLLGLVAFSFFAPLLVGNIGELSLSLAGMVSIAYLLMILLTGSISLLLLVLMGGSQRNAQLINFLVTGFGMLASFSALILNFGSLGFPLVLVYFIPYVQIVAGLLDFVFGLGTQSLILLLSTFLVSVLLIYTTTRLLDPERLILR